MALIGEMQYLTIGENTYSLPSGGGGSVTSVAVSNATNGGLSISGSPISSSGTITIGHSNVLAAAQTTQAVYPIKIDKNGHISAYGSAVTISDTKNTAGSTDSNSKLFLIGATSQAANPQTYSHDTAYVGTDGCLYSNSNKVLVEKYGTDSTGIVISPYAGEYGSIFSIFCNRNDDNENIHNGMQLTVSDSDVNITDMNDERAFLTVYTRSLYPNGNVFITGLPTPTQNDQAANKKYIDDSINALDGSITGTAGAGKTLTAFSQTNGKVTATFGNISITKSQISDFPTIPDVSGKIDTAGTGLSKSGTTLNHSNSVTAQTTQAVYPIKIDAQGHISDYGTAIDLEEMKVFLVTLTQNGTDYVSDKTAEEIINAQNAGRVVIASDYGSLYYLAYTNETHDSHFDAYNATFRNLSVDYGSQLELYDTEIAINTVDGVTTLYDNSQVASLPFADHTHGNITNGGDITTTATIASGDRLVINDESASKVNNSSITFGTSTSQYLANNGTWQNVPSVPTKTSDLTNDSGFITSYTDEKLKVAEVTSGTTYYPLVGTGTTAATRQYDTTGLTYQANNGIANDPSSNGVSILTLGNNKASSSSGWKRGRLKFQNVSYYTELGASKPSANRTVLLPDKTGTIALMDKLL